MFDTKMKSKATRDVAAFLLAVELVVLMAFATSPAAAGAAVTGPTCRSLNATLSFKPPLPAVTSKTHVQSRFGLLGKVGGCTGAGKHGTSAAVQANLAFTGNCLTFVGRSNVFDPVKMLWVGGGLSYLRVTEKLVGPLGQHFSLQLTVYIKPGGPFGGMTTRFLLKGNTGSKTTCLSSSLGTATLTGNTPATFKK